MSKSIDYIENESFVVVNPDCPVISKENALIAIDLAGKEIKDKAIEAYKKACTCIGCNHCDDCDSVREFIQYLNS